MNLTNFERYIWTILGNYVGQKYSTLITQIHNIFVCLHITSVLTLFVTLMSLIKSIYTNIPGVRAKSSEAFISSAFKLLKL
jgi:hypothetical protein